MFMDSDRYLLLLDADDTLWESALFFERTEQDFLSLMSAVGHSEEKVRSTVHRRDVERLSVTGYGARPYMDTLRTIMLELVPETPVWVPAAMDNIERNLLEHPVILLPGVTETLVALDDFPLRKVVYTMGERDHQEDKFRRSGLKDLVDELRVVDVKSANSLTEILNSAGIPPERCIVAGNSPRSDINPTLSIGAHAVHLMRQRTWAAEREDFIDPGLVSTIESFDELPGVITGIMSG